jgi:hypothetical protein
MSLLSTAIRLGVLSGVLWMASFAPVFAQCPSNTQDCNGACIPETALCILEPIPGMPNQFPASLASQPLGPFYAYINAAWPFIVRIAIAIGVLNGVYGGFKVITSNGDSGALDAAKEKLLWTALGIVLFVLSGVLLNFLNPDVFKVL